MKNQAHHLSRRLLAGLIILISTGLVLSGYLFYTNQEKGIREVNFNQLNSIARLKVDEIVQWRKERLGDLHVASESVFFSDAVVKLAQNPDDVSQREMIAGKLKPLIVNYGYENSLVALPDGRILVSFDPAVIGLESQAARLIRQAAATRSFLFGDFYRSGLNGKVYLDLAGPILDQNNNVAAVLLLRVDPQRYLYPLVQTWPTPSQSAETILMRVEGGNLVYLNTLRHDSHAPLTVSVPLSRTDTPAVQGVLGQSGDLSGPDYREVPVFATVLRVPGSDWFMQSKIDQAEIRDQVYFVGGFILLVVILAVLFTAVLVIFIFNRRERGLYKNLYEVEIARLNALEETRTILYSIGDGVIATDEQGRITHINPIAEALTGWSESQAAGRDLTEVFNIINEHSRQPVENPVYRVLREGNIVGLANHTLLITRDGRESPIADSGAPVKDLQGNIQGVVLVFRDQSEERAIQHERSLLSNTISASLDEIYLFAVDTLKFRFVNAGALKNLGYSMAEMQSMTPLDIKPEITPAEFDRLLQPLIDHTLPIQVFETIHERKDGSRYPVEVHLQLYEGEGAADERSYLAIIQDISARRQAEEEIRGLNAQLEQRVADRTIQLEASNKELEAFAYSISHDLRAPLRGIDGWSQALLEDNLDQLDEKGRQYLDRVRSETQRMGSLIDNLLELSRVTRSEMQLDVIDLSALASAIMKRLLERGGSRQVDFQVDEGLNARGDQRLLEIMLTNLLENALKFTSTRAQACIQFSQMRQNGKQVFFIRDNGVGFNMNYTSKLFGAFQRLHKQTEFPGTGIGLATVQRIIHRHGGAIWTEAKPDEGATFFFTL